MNEIKLLKHNQEMVNEIEKAMIMGNHKIFYTEATGLGKSFIFMYLVNKYFKDKKVLYICPKMHIWYNMNAYKEFELIKDCVTMACNADFNEIKEKHLGYDAIFIDEAHHLTAPIQGENILKIADKTIAENPHVYVFGFTATPYVDNNCIGDMYFEKSIFGMDLFDAIDSEILRKINYAVAIRDKIELSEEEKQMTIKYNVDTTKNTVISLVNQYNNVNHWLVYFSYIEELNENLQYFEKYFPEFKIFVIHSQVENCDSVLNEFDSYNGKAMLLSVSMVLEGIHPKTVEGILLYRNVKSNNTFIQVIGRLGIIKPNISPICIGIYNSYRNFISSNNIILEHNFDNNIMHSRNICDYIYMHANTYKFIELSNILYKSYFNICEYRGITWTTDRELSIKLGKNSMYVWKKRKKGMTYEEIIDEVLDSKPNEYRGITWTTDVELSRKLGKSYSYIHMKRKKGMTYEEIIDEVLDSKLNEYRGITWTTDRELSRKLGKYEAYVYYKLKKGMSYEEIIDEVLDS